MPSEQTDVTKLRSIRQKPYSSFQRRRRHGSHIDTEMKCVAIHKTDSDNLAAYEHAVWEGCKDMIKRFYGLK